LDKDEKDCQSAYNISREVRVAVFVRKKPQLYLDRRKKTYGNSPNGGPVFSKNVNCISSPSWVQVFTLSSTG